MNTKEIRYPEKWGPPLIFVFLLYFYDFIFGRFFPNQDGLLGHDYAYVLPNLLAGTFWFVKNGLANVPWFTPAFCGGQPFFADPQNAYFSVPQFLSFAFDPVASVYITMLLFAALGFWGSYVLLRRTFSASRAAACLGGGLFMFNGFFAHRMIVGHTGYHSFMLVCWMALGLTSPCQGKKKAFWIVVTGLLGAYAIHSGVSSLAIPCALSVVLLVLMAEFLKEQLDWRDLGIRALGSGLVVLALTISKITAAGAFMSKFPRADYLLPGYDGLWATVRMAFGMLFVSSSNLPKQSDALVRNLQWSLERQELEYGVTLVPLLLGVMVLGRLVWVEAKTRQLLLSRLRQWTLVAMALLLVLPVALNVYYPVWNLILKQIPMIRSTSLLVRWFCVLVPFLALLGGLCLQSLPARIRPALAFCSLIFVVGTNLLMDRTYYAAQSYDPRPILAAHRQALVTGAVPRIEMIDLLKDSVDPRILLLERNNLVAVGASQLLCYNPVFGYQLEKLPIKQLHPGPVNEISDGRYNMKNPVCYLFGEENRCGPGDHFTFVQGAELESFVDYLPFSFKIPWWQHLANGFTTISWLSCGIFFFWYGISYWVGREKK